MLKNFAFIVINKDCWSVVSCVCVQVCVCERDRDRDEREIVRQRQTETEIEVSLAGFDISVITGFRWVTSYLKVSFCCILVDRFFVFCFPFQNLYVIPLSSGLCIFWWEFSCYYWISLECDKSFLSCCFKDFFSSFLSFSSLVNMCLCVNLLEFVLLVVF